MVVKFSRVDESIPKPSKATVGSACFDLYARSFKIKDKYIEYKLNIKMEIPSGFVGLIFPRSSITNKSLILKNSVGVIDSDYRGEITMRCLRIQCDGIQHIYEKGDKCAQILFIESPNSVMMEIEEESLSKTVRGSGGYGHTGN